jgi:phosphatidylinositol alpha-1,6-mannosyltransferase
MSEAGRILLITNNFPPMVGGSASVYNNLALCEPDHISVLAPSRNYFTGEDFTDWRQHDRNVPYKVIRLPLLRTLLNRRSDGFTTRWLFRAEDLALRFRIFARVGWEVWFGNVRTICLGELLASAWMLRVFRLAFGVRTIVYIHGEEITREDDYDVGHQRARRALHTADAIVVVSRFTYAAVEALIGSAHRNKIHQIENGVDSQLFTPGAKSPALLARYGLEGQFTFVSVCRIVEKKGIDTAIRAFAEVVSHHPNTRYVIIGDGDFAPTLVALVIELKLVEKVIFAGRVAAEELVDHYRLGDVFVMPNRRMPDGDTEGFGLVFLEANSCGIPVIAGCDGGSTDAVTHESNGLVVEGSSVEQVCTAMLRMRADHALRERLAAGGLARTERAGWIDKAKALTALAATPSKPFADELGSWPQIIMVMLSFLILLIVALPWLLLLRLQMVLRLR